MQGVLNVHKPLTLTSHDVVRVVRRMSDSRRVGHTGTLDPLATGVMVLLLGRATRLSRFLLGADKRYRAVVRLGESTSTYDMEGEVIARRPVDLDVKAVEEALRAFRGPIQQVPPMYSALKHKGQKLYQLARQGKVVERAPREIEIYELKLLEWDPPDLSLSIACSTGTYIRSLAHDLGEALGVGGYLRALVRTAVGPFRLESSYSLDTLRGWAAAGRFEEALLPPQAALYRLPPVKLTAEEVWAVRHGQSVSLPDAPLAPEVQAWDEEGELVGVLIPVEGYLWRPNLVLREPD
jgi:tRNA pseudouridine55 synthase